MARTGLALSAFALLAVLATVCQADTFRATLSASKKKGNVTSSTIFDRFCYSHPSSIPSCSVGPFTPLSKRAPEPQTVGGRLAAKTAAYMYTCYQRDSTTCEKDEICYWVDVEGYCTTTSTFLQKLRFSTVCQGSKAEIYSTCADLDKSEAACGTDSRCKWTPCSGSSCVRVAASNSPSKNSSGLCLGNIASMLTNDASILPGLESGDNSVWGCCDAQQLYQDMKACMDIDGSTACTGNCQWNDVRNECEASFSSQYGIWGNKDTTFSTYLGKMDATCQALATEEQCVAEDAVDIDPAKVTKYLSVPLKVVENSCSEVLETEKSSDSFNASAIPSGTASQPAFSASGMAKPLAYWALVLLGLAALLL